MYCLTTLYYYLGNDLSKLVLSSRIFNTLVRPISFFKHVVKNQGSTVLGQPEDGGLVHFTAKNIHMEDMSAKKF